VPRRSTPFFLAGLLAVAPVAQAQDASPPDDWRPMIYLDLGQSPPDLDAAPYAELWQSEIAANDKSYGDQGDTQYAGGHAPATEAHFVVRSTQRVAVLSMLDTATACTKNTADAALNASVKFCPLKVAIYEGGVVTTTVGRRGCFLELTRPLSGDPSNSASYATYDVKTRSFRIGTLVNHEPVPGCVEVIPVDSQRQP
jgi:hypothetical protein